LHTSNLDFTPAVEGLGVIGEFIHGTAKLDSGCVLRGKNPIRESGYVPRFRYDRNARNRISDAAIQMLNIPAGDGQQEHVSDKAQKQKNHGDPELLAHVFGSAIRSWMAKLPRGVFGRGVGFLILDSDRRLTRSAGSRRRCLVFDPKIIVVVE
jgi:hypothetical protein